MIHLRVPRSSSLCVHANRTATSRSQLIKCGCLDKTLHNACRVALVDQTKARMTFLPFIRRHSRHLVRRLLLVALGFVVGQIYRTIDIYRQSGGGDFIDVPGLTFAGIFDLGTVWINYPAAWSISADRPSSGYPSTGASLSAEWGGGGRLSLRCQKGRPETGNGLLRSDFNPPDDVLVLQHRTRQIDLRVSRSGRNANLGPDAVASFLKFMVDTPFPGQVTVSARRGPDQKLVGLYEIPTIGIQNVVATISRNGEPSQPLPEPPSDPFRVMKRWCGS